MRIIALAFTIVSDFFFLRKKNRRKDIGFTKYHRQVFSL